MRLFAKHFNSDFWRKDIWRKDIWRNQFERKKFARLRCTNYSKTNKVEHSTQLLRGRNSPKEKQFYSIFNYILFCLLLYYIHFQGKVRQRGAKGYYGKYTTKHSRYFFCDVTQNISHFTLLLYLNFKYELHK